MFSPPATEVKIVVQDNNLFFADVALRRSPFLKNFVNLKPHRAGFALPAGQG